MDASAAALLRQTAAKRYQAAPVGFADDGALVLAVSDPADSLGLSDIAVMTKLPVRPAVAARSQIAKLLDTIVFMEEPVQGASQSVSTVIVPPDGDAVDEEPTAGPPSRGPSPAFRRRTRPPSRELARLREELALAIVGRDEAMAKLGSHGDQSSAAAEREREEATRSLRLEHERDMAAAETAAEEALRAERASAQQALTSLRAKHDETLEAERAKRVDEVEAERERTAAAIDAERERNQKELEALRGRLTEELETARAEAEAARSEAAAARDEAEAALKEAAAAPEERLRPPSRPDPGARAGARRGARAARAHGGRRPARRGRPRRACRPARRERAPGPGSCAHRARAALRARQGSRGARVATGGLAQATGE